MGGITGVAVLAPESPYCCDVRTTQPNMTDSGYQNTAILLQRMVSVHKVEAQMIRKEGSGPMVKKYRM